MRRPSRVDYSMPCSPSNDPIRLCRWNCEHRAGWFAYLRAVATPRCDERVGQASQVVFVLSESAQRLQGLLIRAERYAPVAAQAGLVDVLGYHCGASRRWSPCGVAGGREKLC
jgi:hypothetical protein